jgi:hypothetical protein
MRAQQFLRLRRQQLLVAVRSDVVTEPVFIEAIGFAAPGLANWRASLPILRNDQPYVLVPLASQSPALLPPNERRRATPTVRLAFQAAEDAIQTSSISPADLATVFASSDADLGIIHRICSALTVMPRMISPTDFHNSVHNAAAGYWSIAVGSRAPSSTLSAHDYSFAAGLVEACNIALGEGRDTLLVAFDLPPPEPLYSKRPIAHPVGVALVLTQQSTQNSLAELRYRCVHDAETALIESALEALRLSNPAARALPLLKTLAQKQTDRIVLSLNQNARLAIELSMV